MPAAGKARDVAYRPGLTTKADGILHLRRRYGPPCGLRPRDRPGRPPRDL